MTIFMVWSYVNSLHRMPPLACLYMNDLGSYQSYYIQKAGCIYSVPIIRYTTLFLYYRVFRISTQT